MRIKRLVAILLAAILIASGSVAYAVDWVAVITDKSTIYEKWDKSSTVLGTLKSNKIVALQEVKNGWAKIKLNGKIGYMNASNVKKTTMKMYVKVSELAFYESYSTSSKKLTTLSYGACVNLKAVNGEWAMVVSNGDTAYCKYSSLTSTDPNTMSKTVYPQKNNVKVYSAPNSSSEVMGTVSISTKLTCTCIYDGWCRVKSGSKVGFIQKSYLDTTKYDGYSTSKAASGQSVSMDWWKSDIQSIFSVGTVATVTDVETGISWKVKRWGGKNHADVEPLTAEDTKAMKKACGSDYGTWHRRAIWVSINGKKYAASMNCMPHGECGISNNGFKGHHCIHFTNSRTHCSNKVDADHQNAIKKALNAG